MSITTYAGLQQALNDWLNNPALEQMVPTFIALAEAGLNRELRTRDMLVRADATSSDEYVALPSDFLEMYSLKQPGTSDQAALKYVGVEEAKELLASNITSPVRYFTIVGSSVQIIPAPADDTDYEMLYYAKIAALTDNANTNWLLTKAPDLYLYAALVHAAPYLPGEQRGDVFATMRQQIMDGMQIESERSMRQQTQLNAKRRAF